MWLVIICVLLVFYLATDRESFKVDGKRINGKKAYVDFMAKQAQAKQQAEQQAKLAFGEAHLSQNSPLRNQSPGNFQVSNLHASSIVINSSDPSLDLPTISRDDYNRHLQAQTRRQ